MADLTSMDEKNEELPRFGEKEICENRHAMLTPVPCVIPGTADMSWGTISASLMNSVPLTTMLKKHLETETQNRDFGSSNISDGCWDAGYVREKEKENGDWREDHYTEEFIELDLLENLFEYQEDVTNPEEAPLSEHLYEESFKCSPYSLFILQGCSLGGIFVCVRFWGGFSLEEISETGDGGKVLTRTDHMLLMRRLVSEELGITWLQLLWKGWRMKIFQDLGAVVLYLRVFSIP